MLARRQLIGGTVLSSLFTGASPAAASAEQPSDRSIEDVVRALKDLRTAIEAPQSFAEIIPIRQKLVEFLRAQMKLPDFLDVGVDVWYAAYDWHVKHLQPVTVERDTSGRYTLMLMQTALVMRPDLDRSFVGVPYDSR
jgi:hypothetical protein